jgi:hypothetical protein
MTEVGWEKEEPSGLGGGLFQAPGSLLSLGSHVGLEEILNIHEL